jgi:hypothetical protein
MKIFWRQSDQACKKIESRQQGQAISRFAKEGLSVKVPARKDTIE